MSLKWSLTNTLRARPACVGWADWLRPFALMITLLALALQQRVLTPTMRPSAAVVRVVAERPPSIETHALRAQPALRVAITPAYVRLFARVPWSFEAIASWPRADARIDVPASCADQLCASVSHFHSKRRIPRMNSEEPPRA